MNDPIVEIALGAYADEPCRICGKKLTREDINTAVFVGYSSDNKSRAAHITCFQNTSSIFDELHRQLAECQQQRDRLRTALERIEKWSQAYPLSVFPKPDYKKAHALLQAGGMTLDNISADTIRRVIVDVGNVAKKALAGVRASERENLNG